MAAIVSKLDNLGRDMKKLKKNLHVIQVDASFAVDLISTRNAHLTKKLKVAQEDDDLPSNGLPCQLLPKEVNPGNEEDNDTDEGWEDPKKCGEEKMNAILDTVLDKLDDSWFSGTIQDEADLDGITNYLEPTSYDGFIDSEDEAYKERSCKLLGMPYRIPPLISIERVKVAFTA
ncbi:hypothetical protein Tco_1508898 [Tanacetum coccineum]